MLFLAFIYLFIISTVVSLVVTRLTLHLAHRFEVYDHPGEIKLHSTPIPLLGGVAIFITIVVVISSHALFFYHIEPSFLYARILSPEAFQFLEGNVSLKLTGLLAGACMFFFLGLWDDLKTLTPYQKLIGQICSALIPVMCGVRLDLFVENPLFGGVVTVGWIVLMSNSMNLLDNMDGLSGGVTVIASLLFFAAVFPLEQYFAGALLLILAGATLGFLYFNFNPARIFMGDAGAMFCGYVLAALSVLCTFYTTKTPTRGAVIIPILILAVPLFDTFSVIYLRIRDKQSIIMGDKQRHFSHRLVRLGMSTRSAVLFIYIVTFVTGAGAILLGHADWPQALIVLIQELGMFVIIILLMMVGSRPASLEDPGGDER